MRGKTCFLLLVLCTALFFRGSCEESTGALTGLITDPHGAIIQGVNIRVQHWKFDLDKSSKAIMQCDAILYSGQNGRFTVKLKPGIYDLFVASPGMSPVAKEVEIKGGRDTTLDFQLTFSPLTKFIK